MKEAYTFPAYEEKMMAELKKFGGQRMETYKGYDMTPLWDMKGRGISWSYKYLYSAPKLEKIVFSAQSYRDKLMTYTTLLWPDDNHALPIYSSFWAESAKGSYLIVDFYPTADCICDMPYMEKYLEPLEDIFKCAIKDYSKYSNQDLLWFRALASPLCIMADIGPSTKESQDKLLTLTIDYLKVYHGLWEKDEPQDEVAMKRLNERKKAIRQNLKDKDPGGLMMESAVGHELTELSLIALF